MSLVEYIVLQRHRKALRIALIATNSFLWIGLARFLFLQNGLSVRCKQCERYYRQEKKYGIDERDLLILQDGVCAICGVDDPCHPSGWFVDHDHKTGNARGMICSICNTSVAAVDFAGISWFDRARAYYDSPPASLVNVECKRKSTRLASWRGNVPDGMSYCVACQAFKPMSEFHKKKRSKYGIVSKCRYCIRLYTQVRSYGIDERMLLDVQDDACGICRTIDPNHSNGWQIDHDHKTGKARGVLCNLCNNGMNGIDSVGVGWIDSAREYLRKPLACRLPK